jgi:hypothetical protein
MRRIPAGHSFSQAGENARATQLWLHFKRDQRVRTAASAIEIAYAPDQHT